MNPFVAAGAAALIGVLIAYVVVTRRELARAAQVEGKAKGDSPAEAAIAEGERPTTEPPRPT